MTSFLLAWTAAEALAFVGGCAGIVLVWVCFSLTEDRKP